MNALLRKEIRDAVRWLPMGIALLGVILIYVSRTIHAPSLSSQLTMIAWLSSLLYGSFLSLVTFLPDEREAARAFLIHRAISPDQIFRIRILVGLIVYGLGMLIPFGALAIYLASIGPVRLPVSPWQVVPAFLVIVTGTSFYFAGIAIACRPSNWFGTRLLPLATAIAGNCLPFILLIHIPMIVTVPVYALSCMSALVMAFAARHSFVRTPSELQPTRLRSMSMATNSVLLSSSILIVGAVGLLPVHFLDQAAYMYPTIEFDKDGMPIYAIRSSARNRGGINEVLESIPMTDSSDSKTEGIAISDIGPHFSINTLRVPSNQFDPTFVQASRDGQRQLYFDPSGYLLVYQVNPVLGMVLDYVIASDAVSLPNESRGTPFRRIPRFLTLASFYPSVPFGSERPHPTSAQFDRLAEWAFVTSDGIKRVDLQKRTIETLIEESIDSIGFPVKGGIERFAVQSGDSVRIYKSEMAEAGIEPKQFTLESTLKTGGKSGGFLRYLDSENWIYLDGYAMQRYFHVTRSIAGKTREYTFVLPRETLASLGRVRSESLFVFGALPPVLTIGSLIITQTFIDFNTNDYIPLFLQMMVSIALTFFASRYRGLRPRQMLLWCSLAVLFGLGVPLAAIAIYPLAVYECCSACHRRRRVEIASCEHCGANWDALPSEGIEVMESEAVETLVAAGPA